MYLKDYLQQRVKENDKTRLYIGSSSAFLCIGNAEFCLNNLDKISKRCLSNFKQSKEKAIKEKYDLEHNKVYKSKNEKDLKKEKEQVQVQIAQCERRIANLTRIIDEFKPILTRKILVDEYGNLDLYVKNAMPDELGLSIRIEGEENGKFWTYKEWKNVYGEQD